MRIIDVIKSILKYLKYNIKRKVALLFSDYLGKNWSGEIWNAENIHKNLDFLLVICLSFMGALLNLCFFIDSNMSLLQNITINVAAGCFTGATGYLITLMFRFFAKVQKCNKESQFDIIIRGMNNCISSLINLVFFIYGYLLCFNYVLVGLLMLIISLILLYVIQKNINRAIDNILM